MLSNIEISKQSKKKCAVDIAEAFEIDKRYIIPYGKYFAKVDLSLLDEVKNNKKGKYVLVSAINPTPYGEGKTVTSIGLSMALNQVGKKASVCLRQPSMGPVFGIKGGGTGGGYSQIVPMEDINLNFTGDIHAVSIAHNLAAAFLDNSIFKGNCLNINRINWKRVIDVNDRSLRDIATKVRDIKSPTGFDIAAASEIMAILALSNGFRDLRTRIGRIILGYDDDDKPITCNDIKVAGSMSAILKEALKPNLAQTIENTICFVHAGPFANIAHGSNSILADIIAIHLSDYVITEAGFGADCGAEKFFNIKCRVSGLKPDAAVLVCTIRGLKFHCGRFESNEDLSNENIEALEDGISNLQKHLENIKLFGVPVVVALNKFDSDTEKEINFVKKKALEFGANDCHICEVWSKGGEGGVELAKSVINACKKESNFRFLYDLDMTIKEKIHKIATKIYGAKDVEYSDEAEEKIKMYDKLNWENLPICMAKTQFSLSHDPKLKGRPKDFILPVRDIKASIGAGFLYALCGNIMTMPGLPTHPVGEDIDINKNGEVVGLS